MKVTMLAPDAKSARKAIVKARRDAKRLAAQMASLVGGFGLLAGMWISRALAGEGGLVSIAFAAAMFGFGLLDALRLAARLDNLAMFSDMLRAFDEAEGKGIKA